MAELAGGLQVESPGYDFQRTVQRQLQDSVGRHGRGVRGCLNAKQWGEKNLKNILVKILCGLLCQICALSSA